MTPRQLEKRCKALFGRFWILELAFNLRCSPQNIRQIMDGIHNVKPQTIMLIEAWENGLIPIKHRPPPARQGRKPVSRKMRGHAT